MIHLKILSASGSDWYFRTVGLVERCYHCGWLGDGYRGPLYYF